VQTFRPHWDASGAGDQTSRVTWEIEQQGPICLLTVVHDEWSSMDGMYQQTAGGWPLILSGLKTLLETGEPLTG
ncbi:MAG: ArsR family transcriptional regulator, partial [Actinomycetota bacterium]|nr:ArsR family transcriptional regulator [Actinomycetota bacterium]